MNSLRSTDTAMTWGALTVSKGWYTSRGPAQRHVDHVNGPVDRRGPNPEAFYLVTPT